MDNATSIHWHGQYQNTTNFFDGTSGVTQCGIPTNQTLSYNLTVQNVGTYWSDPHLPVFCLIRPFSERRAVSRHACLTELSLFLSLQVARTPIDPVF
jgi:hypothetical protein